MKEITKIDLSAPIIPNEGRGDIKLGIKAIYLRDLGIFTRPKR